MILRAQSTRNDAFLHGANDTFQTEKRKACFPLSFKPLTGIYLLCSKSRNAYQVRFFSLSIIVTFVTILIRLCCNLPGERDKLISTLRNQCLESDF